MNRFEVTLNEQLAPDVVRMRVRAERPARFGKPGQFVIVRPFATSERIPLTICAAEPAGGSIDLVIQVVGATTADLAGVEPGNRLADVVGPLGTPTEIERYGTVVAVAGGVGIAIALPVARALHEAGNTVIGILGARDRDHVILESEFAQVTAALDVLTDDGSWGRRGLVTDGLARILDSGRVDLVHAVGPIPMMRAVAEMTRPYGIRTVASLNPIMVDGTGMCGGCRVSVNGESRFACVDGPEFDAHLVDFELLARRNRAFAAQETAMRETLHV